MKTLLQRYKIALIFCLITFISTGCAATADRKVHDELLEQNKSTTFKIGIVKAAGDASFDTGSDDIEYRIKALNKIPIEEVCSILTRTYSLTIDVNVDKTAKVVREDKAAIEDSMRRNDPVSRPTWENNQKTKKGYPLRRDSIPKIVVDVAEDIAVEIATDVATELASAYMHEAAIKNAYKNAYYGNLEYENASSFRIKNNEEFPDVINVTYSLVYEPFEVAFYYDISIRSSEQDIAVMHGLVGSIKSPTDYANENQAAVWNSYVDFAGHISEALKRDLSKPINISHVERIREALKWDSHAEGIREALKKEFHAGSVSGDLNRELSETAK